MSPNGYYNYLKKRKQQYEEEKAEVQRKIVSIYHEANGVPGYRMMRNLLSKYDYEYSNLTIYSYMKELGLSSICRRRKPDYKKGKAHKIFPNLVNQNFTVDAPNKVWCTDFTYLPYGKGKMHYNCAIIDLYDRSIVASENGPNITADLAISTLNKAIKYHKPKKGLILHSDQGSQYTSKEFNGYCIKHHVQQSMSRAGCPYDNAPMERFYNTYKNEFFYLYTFDSIEQLNQDTNDFIYGWYNHVRPHTFNGGSTPNEARYSAKN